MAANIKQTFIDALRLTPDGIAAFLTAPLPEPPSLTTPADVDAAIIANGICAKYILDLFTPFAGLTPVELLLRIGQHNSVLESGLLAGLQYLGSAEAGTSQNQLRIVEPVDGQTYGVGNLRMQVTAKDGSAALQNVVARIGTNDIQLGYNGTFWGFTAIDTPGDYAVAFTGSFSDNSTVTASLTITIAAADPEAPPTEQPTPPGGTDKTALQTAIDNLMKHLRELMSQNVLSVKDRAIALVGLIQADVDVIYQTILAMVKAGSVGKAVGVLVTGAEAIVSGLIDALKAQINAADVEGAQGSVGDILGIIGKITNAAGITQTQ